MRGFTAVLLEELSRRRQLMVAAAAAALLPLVLPYLMRLDHPVAEVRELLAWIIGLLCGGLYALFLGASFIGSDLAAGRLGFSFARPVSATSIWFGKLTAVCLLSTGSLLLILVPAALLDWSSFTNKLDGFASLPNLLVAPLAIILVSHAVGIMARARSPWLLLDVAGIAAASVICWRAYVPILAAGAPVALWHGVVALAAAILLALIIAGACQVACGRADLRRAHGALSISLWTVVLAGALGQVGYSRWLRSAEPVDLVSCERVLAQPGGTWFAVAGTARGRADFTTALLVNTDGRWLRLGNPRSWYNPWFVFSADTAVYLRDPYARGAERDLVTIDLGQAEPRLRSTGLSARGSPTGSPCRLAYCSADGHLATLMNDLLTVHDLSSQQLLLSMGVKDNLAAMLWVAPDLLQIYVHPSNTTIPRELRIIEVDVTQRRHQVTGRHFSAPVIYHTSLNLDRRSRHMLLNAMRFRPEDGAHIKHVMHLDAVSGEPDPSFDPAALDEVERAVFLFDDRIVAEEVRGGAVSLRLLTPHGDLIRHIGLGEGQALEFGGQPTANRLIAVVFADKNAVLAATSRTVEVDLATGTVRLIGEGLTPVLTRPEWLGDRNAQPEPPGGIGTRLFTKGGTLLLWDETTGELNPILGGSKPRLPRQRDREGTGPLISGICK